MTNNKFLFSFRIFLYGTIYISYDGRHWSLDTGQYLIIIQIYLYTSSTRAIIVKDVADLLIIIKNTTLQIYFYKCDY